MLRKLRLTAKTGGQYRIIVSDGIQRYAIIILDDTQQQRHMGDMLIIHTDGTTAHLAQIAKSLRHHIHSSVH